MVQGINTAAAGMASIIDLNDIVANNLANVNTVGFKQLMPTFKNIHKIDVHERNNDNQMNPGQNKIGNLSAGSMIDETQLDLTQGALKQTEKPLDVALNGDGFFVVQNETGEFYTRNGNFSVDEEGNLLTGAGDKVIGESGKGIKIDTIGVSIEDILITDDGAIMQGDMEVDRLKLVDFEDKSKLKLVGHSLFKNTDENAKPIEPNNCSTAQGYLELSNANVVKSMIDSITGARTYETLSKVIRNTDSTLRKTVNEVGTVMR